MILKIVYTDLYWAAGHNVDDRSYSDDLRYAYELFFDDQADKEMIKERMLYVYNSSKEYVERIKLPSRLDGYLNNSWHWYIDGRIEKIQPGNRGWAYYSFPPIGYHGYPHSDQDKTMDPRVVIDGLFQDPVILSHLTEFKITAGERSWVLRGISREEELNGYKAAEIIVYTPERHDASLVIRDAKIAFPYTFADGVEITLVERAPFTTPFFVILKAEYRIYDDIVKISMQTDKLSFSGPEDVTVQLLFGSIQVNDEPEIRGDFFSCDVSMLGNVRGDVKCSGAYRTFSENIPGWEMLDLLPQCVITEQNVGDEERSLLYFCNPAFMPERNTGGVCLSYLEHWTDILGVQNGTEIDADSLMVAFFRAGTGKDAATAYDNALITALRMRNELAEMERAICHDKKMHVDRIEREKVGRAVTYTLNAIYSDNISIQLTFEDARRRSVIWPEELVITIMLEQKKYAITYTFTDTDTISLEEVIYFEGQERIPVEGRLNSLHLENLSEIGNLLQNTGLLESFFMKSRIDRKGSRRSYGESGLGFFLNRGNYEAPEILMDQLARPLADWLPIMDDAVKGINGNESEDISMADHLKLLFFDEGTDYKLPPLPNLAIIGEAGTGKTTLARKLVEDCLGGTLESVVGGDLKPVYIGWAKASLASRINRIQKKHKDRKGPAVVFIDEAYNLFEEDKESRRTTGDVVELLLALTSAKEDPDDPGYKYTIRLDELSDKDMRNLGLVERDTAENYDDDDEEETHEKIIRAVKVRTDTYIWLGGYKDRLLSSFQTNEGLNRRFERITIPSPKLPELHRYFNRLLNEEDKTLITAIRGDVEDFLHWAKSPSISAIFGNYSGVEKLARYCHNRMKNVAADEKQQAAVKAINELKAEILENYRYQLMSEIGKLPFEAALDLHETLDDYAGAEQVKGKIRNIVEMMLDESRFRRFGVTLPKGALLAGPPGTGKTYLARCMAGEMLHELQERKSSKDVAFYAVSAGEILGQKDPLKALSALFATANEFDYVIIFFDEIDSIGMQRDNNSNRTVLIQLMKEMDGFVERNNLFVLAATNEPDELDDALLREGRFDMIITVENPDRASSIELLTMYLGKYDIEYAGLPEALQKRYLTLLGGVVPASIKGMLNEAAMLYLRCENGIRKELYKKFPLDYAHRRKADDSYMLAEDPEHIDPEILVYDLKEVIDTKKIGSRKEKVEEENGFKLEHNRGMSATAVHELGHAITAFSLGQKRLERITILSRGGALGYVEYSRDAREFSTRKEYLDQITVMLGGRIAEELVYGEENVSHGASQDLQDASGLARTMVGELGFSDKLGMLVTGATKYTYHGQKYVNFASEDMLAKRDEEAGKILSECAERARNILSERKEILLTLAKELYDAQELSGIELKKRYEELVEKGGKE